jgi:uncharacterized membrane protein YhhN
MAATLLVVFALVSEVRLVATALDVDWLARGSTFLLMPSLAAWVVARHGPMLVFAALLFSALGDALLGHDALFITGMGSFGLAHVCYVGHFLRIGARPRWYVGTLYLVALAGLMVWLWPGLGDLQTPVAVYALLLTSTAVLSWSAGVWTGLGGGLFFISDALIAVGLADRSGPPMPDLWIMSTYIAAQFLLASGAVRRADSAA